MAIFNKKPDDNNNTVLNKIKEVSFFNMFADDIDVLKKIASLCTSRSFDKGKVIIKEGDYGDELFIILSGSIEIIKKTLQNQQYTVVKLTEKMGGVAVGELALIDNDQRSATVIAETPCECLVINRDKFIKFGDENPQIGLPITRVLASQTSTKLRKANSDVITLFSALVEEIDNEE